MKQFPIAHCFARRLAQAGVRGASFYWRFAERVSPITDGPASFDGISMHVNPSEYGTLNMYKGLYERAEVKVLSGILKPGMTAVDVGANAGYYTRIFSKIVGPAGCVEAFEPNPVCWPSLADLPSNVRLHRLALGDHAATVTLRNIGDAGNRLHATLVDFAAFTENPGVFREAEVEMRTLDDVLEEQGVRNVDVLKIDVEGFDAEVLHGAERLIAEGRVGHILVEVSPEYVPVDFVDWLIATAGPQYRASRVAEEGRLVARPVLRPVGGEKNQYNLLLSRVSAGSG